MDLTSIGKELARIGLPILGEILPIPGAAAITRVLANQIGAASSDPGDILSKLATDPKALAEARKFEAENRATMLRIITEHEARMRAADSQDLATINATIQAELVNAAQEAWYQKAWRPACGFSVAAGSFAAVLFVCALFYQALISGDIASTVSVVPSLASAIALILGVPGAAVGIAAWHRGRQKITAIERLAGGMDAAK